MDLQYHELKIKLALYAHVKMMDEIFPILLLNISNIHSENANKIIRKINEGFLFNNQINILHDHYTIHSQNQSYKIFLLNHSLNKDHPI